MGLTVHTKTFVRLLRQAISNSRRLNPCGLRLKATATSLTFQAISTTLAFQTEMSASAETLPLAGAEDVATFEGRNLSPIAAALDGVNDQRITLVVDDESHQFTVRTSDDTYVVPQYLDPDDFGDFEIPVAGVEAHVSLECLAEIAQQTSFAVDLAEGRGQRALGHGAVRVELSGGNVVAAATDAARLAISSITAGEGAKVTMDMLLPPDALRAIRMVSDDHVKGESVVVFCSTHKDPDRLMLRIGNAKIIVFSDAKAFPDWRKVDDDAGKEFIRTLTFERENLLAAINRVTCLVGNDETLHCQFLADELRMFVAGTVEPWQARGVLKLEERGPEITIAFNPRFLTDGLRATKAKEVTVSLGGPTETALVSTTRGFRYWISPVCISRIPEPGEVIEWPKITVPEEEPEVIDGNEVEL